jgi:hypothetical protein
MYVLLDYKKVFIKYVSFLVVVIYIVFLNMDAITKNLGNDYSLYLKYSTIILCFILSLLIGSEGCNNTDKLLVQSARLFTVIADYFLVILDDCKYGILCFCIVQIIYIIRHSFVVKVKLYKLSLAAALIMTSLIMLLGRINLHDLKKEVVMEGAAYGCILLLSLYIALQTKDYLICIGMLLFFMCDINVALYNITKEFTLGFLIWLFYMPSQLFLTLSGFKNEYLKHIFKG